ncbi:outer membrane lipoprotein LolB [Allopusillimonas ginsengisoli]|uniref:outer membrane lipoprotein LolB n=1 Tax=Allopusillimonas ginsengisoli TaxID=453575 RepID=UPI001021C595|nr:outer membrane lipoprotein LolB [Allopusillimonas ginsengisoli]TEA77526.1 outer membrane lipoprotein LolB [Allopusillimonas ginsengisoli]
MKSGLSIVWRSATGAALVALLLAGCATPQKISRTEGMGDPALVAAPFERTGRFALNVGYANGQRDAVQGGFAWLDSGKRLRLDLANPVGSTLARIDVTPARAVVTRSDGSTEQAADADGLVEMALGSPLPVSGLRDWLRGRTGQGGQVSNLEKNSQGQITGFTQDGWRVRLSRYNDQGPGLVQLNRDDSSRSISARLVIDG